MYAGHRQPPSTQGMDEPEPLTTGTSPKRSPDARRRENQAIVSTAAAGRSLIGPGLRSLRPLTTASEEWPSTVRRRPFATARGHVASTGAAALL
jgi:hypothetical protein